MNPRYLLLILVVCMLVGGVQAWGADMGAWGFRKEITFTNTGANLTNYQIKFTVNRSSGSDSGSTVYLDGKCESNYNDIRFTTGDGNTLCDYWIESSSSTVATIWVEIPSIVNSTAYGSTKGYLYYKNAGASAASNGDNTFIFFDDFPGSSINTSKWDRIGTSGTTTVSGGKLIIAGAAADNAWEQQGTDTLFNTPVFYESYSKLSEDTASASRRWAFGSQSASGYCDIGVHTDGTKTYRSATTGTTTSARTSTLTSYTVMGVLRDGTNVKFYEDYAIKATITTNVLTGTAYMLIGSRSDDAYITVDWARIRQYAANEPTISAWGNEECIGSLDAEMGSPIPVSGTGYAPLLVSFFDSSIAENCTIDYWNWSFGDGHYSDSQNPQHLYTSSGLFEYDLIVGNTTWEIYDTASDCPPPPIGGCHSIYEVLVNTDIPIADFTVTETCGKTTDTFYFIDFSTGGGLYAWNWSFGDGSYSELRNPTHQYAANGTYDVNLTVWGAYGTDYLLRENLITIPCGAPTPTPTPTPTATGTPAGLTADFYAFPTSGQANLTVHFTDDSTGSPSNWNWTFDYGNPASPTSTDQNPSHTYSVDGWYTVSLTAGDGTNSNTEIKTRYIHVGNVTQGIPERHGETWIRWTWTPNATYPYDIYIDGILSEPANTLGYYYLTGLNPNEKHRIDLYDSGNPIATSTTTTDKESYLAYILVIMGVVFAIITMLVIEPGKVILSGGLTFIISMYLATNTWSQLGPISFIGIGLTIFAGVWIARAVWALCRDRAAWW